MIVARAAVALVLVGLLAGCTASPEAAPTPDTTVAALAECEAAVEGIVAAVDELVAGYEEPLTVPTPGPSPSDASSPSPRATVGAETGDALADAVAAARETRDRLDCDEDEFTGGLEEGLSGIRPESAIALAVWRRVEASLLGRVGQDAAERRLQEGEDLHVALAQAPEGTTLLLPAGTVDVEGTLVLLQGVTLRGAGRDATTIRSDSTEAAIIVATGSLVRLEGLTIELAGDHPSSGVVAGPSASISLSGVRVAGAPSGGEGVGGAGVYLSAQGVDAAGRGTTLEITDSVFERNEWVGVAVAGGHRVSIESSTFSANGQVGVLFLDASSGSVSGSTFDGNTIGLAASGSATPTLLSSTVSGGSVGVQVDGSATPTIDGVRIAGSSAAAVIFGGASGGSLTGTVCDGVPYGIVVSDTAAPTLRDNTCPVARGAS